MFINIIFKHNLSNHHPGIEINYYALLVEVLLPQSKLLSHDFILSGQLVHCRLHPFYFSL